MKIRNHIIIALAILPIWSCNRSENKKGAVEFKKEYNLQHKAYDAELLISSGRLGVIDSFLILTNHRNEPVCRVYALNENMKEVYSYGRLGGGPGEYMTPLLTYVHNNTFGLFEFNKRELAIMQLMSQNGNVSIAEITHLKAPRDIKKGEFFIPDGHFTRLTDDHYVSTIFADDGRFFNLLDNNLSEINHFGESPIPEKLDLSGYLNRMQGKIATYDGTMVYASSNLPYLASYRLKNNEMQKQWHLFYNEPHYGVRNGDLLFSKEKSYGKVIDLEMDSKFIYLLYLDQLLSEYDDNNPEKSHANIILVFDLEGNPVARVHLSCRIYTMALTNGERKLYGLADLPEPTIVEFEMPKQLINKK